MEGLPNIEVVSRAVHEGWRARKQRMGIKSRRSETGEELMIDYDELSEAAKETNRDMVRTVYSAIEAVNSAAQPASE